jgi:hypothetical protein
VTSQSKLLLAAFWDTVDEITAQWLCAANISLVREQSQLPPAGHRVWSTYVQSEMLTNENGLKNLGHKGPEEKAWDDWFCDLLQNDREQMMCVVSKVEENPWSAGRRGKAGAVAGGSVIIQSLNLTHVESLWWRIDWKPCRKKIGNEWPDNQMAQVLSSGLN